jgi:hypothetical protein
MKLTFRHDYLATVDVTCCFSGHRHLRWGAYGKGDVIDVIEPMYYDPQRCSFTLSNVMGPNTLIGVPKDVFEESFTCEKPKPPKRRRT